MACKLYSLSDAIKLTKDEGMFFTRLAWRNQGFDRIVLLLNSNDLAIDLLNKYDKCLPEINDYNILLLIDNTMNKYIFNWQPSIYDIMSDDWIEVTRKVKRIPMTKAERIVAECNEREGVHVLYKTVAKLLCNKFPDWTIEELENFAIELYKARMEDYDLEIEEGL